MVYSGTSENGLPLLWKPPQCGQESTVPNCIALYYSCYKETSILRTLLQGPAVSLFQRFHCKLPKLRVQTHMVYSTILFTNRCASCTPRIDTIHKLQCRFYIQWLVYCLQLVSRGTDKTTTIFFDKIWVTKRFILSGHVVLSLVVIMLLYCFPWCNFYVLECIPN